MSRALKPDAITALEAKGVTPVAHVIGLDGIGIFLNNLTASNGSYDVSSVSIPSSELYILNFQMGF